MDPENSQGGEGQHAPPVSAMHPAQRVRERPPPSEGHCCPCPRRGESRGSLCKGQGGWQLPCACRSRQRTRRSLSLSAAPPGPGPAGSWGAGGRASVRVELSDLGREENIRVLLCFCLSGEDGRGGNPVCVHQVGASLQRHGPLSFREQAQGRGR